MTCIVEDEAVYVESLAIDAVVAEIASIERPDSVSVGLRIGEAGVYLLSMNGWLLLFGAISVQTIPGAFAILAR